MRSNVFARMFPTFRARVIIRIGLT